MKENDLKVKLISIVPRDTTISILIKYENINVNRKKFWNILIIFNNELSVGSRPSPMQPL